MYYVQGKNYGYKRTVDGGIATISYGDQSIREVSKKDFEDAVRQREQEFMSLREGKRNEQRENKLIDYNALLRAGIPEDTARRLTQYYG